MKWLTFTILKIRAWVPESDLSMIEARLRLIYKQIVA